MNPSQSPHCLRSENPDRLRSGNPNRLRSGSLLLAGAFVALTGLSACAGNTGVVYNKNFTAGYSPSGLAALRTPLLVETFGSPAAGVSQEAVTASTVDGLRNSGPRWTQIGYSGDPSDAPNPPYRLRFAYGAPNTFLRSDLCTEDLVAGDIGSDAENRRTVVALCRGERYVSIAEGSAGANADIGSRAFGEFVGTIGRQVMPRNNPVIENECLFRICD